MVRIEGTEEQRRLIIVHRLLQQPYIIRLGSGHVGPIRGVPSRAPISHRNGLHIMEALCSCAAVFHVHSQVGQSLSEIQLGSGVEAIRTECAEAIPGLIVDSYEIYIII